jgi:hypothetical protein
VQLDLLAIILFVDILVVFLMLVRALWHLHEKKPIPQGVGHGIKKHKTGQALLTFLCKALLTFLGFVGLSLMTATVAHAAGPEDHPRYRNPPLLGDGSTAPELSLRPPTGSAAGSTLNPEAGPSAASNPIPYLPDQADLIEKDNILQHCKDQMFRCWQTEPLRTKRMLQPSTGGMPIEMVIHNFLQRRWQHASLEEIRAQKDELMTYRGHSDCYLDWRNLIERR